jgi:hypothetical protein
MSGRPIIIQQICGHAVQPEFDGAPLGHHTVQNPIKGGAVIMLPEGGSIHGAGRNPHIRAAP